MKKYILRTLIEMGFIVFLFYSNLLMGEYTSSNSGRTHGLFWAIKDVITGANLIIALVTAFIGHIVFEYLRKRS